MSVVNNNITTVLLIIHCGIAILVVICFVAEFWKKIKEFFVSQRKQKELKVYKKKE
ncbi:MAG: hypothetical protein LBF97_01650 [Elusimicrobiota bacterium]|jgi:hypothetical protein|nr:hypothetical protein [Elusimicrobiota bacterium]